MAHATTDTNYKPDGAGTFFFGRSMLEFAAIMPERIFDAFF